MKVSKIMTKTVGFCQPEDNLAEAVKIMWELDCGIVPVVNRKKEVIGTITDRDISVSVFLQNKPPTEILLDDVMTEKVFICSEDEKIESALKKMRKNQVKRLPVVKENGKLCGIISITDILLAAREEKSLRKKIFKTLEEISKPRSIILKEI